MTTPYEGLEVALEDLEVAVRLPAEVAEVAAAPRERLVELRGEAPGRSGSTAPIDCAN